jgi:hypothetical protein
LLYDNTKAFMEAKMELFEHILCSMRACVSVYPSNHSMHDKFPNVTTAKSNFWCLLQIDIFIYFNAFSNALPF